MREIKFRAFIDGRMITDKQDFIPLIVTNKGVMRLNAETESDNWEIVKKEEYPRMQYADFKDVNKKELCDKDIILFLGEIYIIEYTKGAFVLLNEDNDECELLRDIDTNNCELVGNIYENPELLKN